jgi:DNA replication protein DnaC
LSSQESGQDGKSHLAAALGLALVQNGRRVLFMRTADLVQRLQPARREPGLEAAITKLDKYRLLILETVSATSSRITPRPACCSS